LETSFASLQNIGMPGGWLTIGSFDGVHLGHQALIRQLVSGAHQAGAPAIVITFFPHPVVVLRGSQGQFYLTSPEERAALLSRLGVDAVVTLTFDDHLRMLPAEEFMRQVQNHLRIRRLLVGYNFALGRGREGNVERLRELGGPLGYELSIFEPVELAGQAVSSSLVRAQLAAGAVDQAARSLGRPYCVSAGVIHGDGRGKTIGIPTANLDVWAERALPAVGVYAGYAEVDGRRYQAVTNIGVRPTFESSAPLRVETHILDFDRDLYGEMVRLSFVARLRGEQRFPSIDALIAQIRQDIQTTRRVLSHDA
jgi:riboflavin kinase/FMN adenylyltransferase